MTKCESHDHITADVSSTKTDVKNIKASIGVLFDKIDRLVIANLITIVLLLIVIGEKVLPYIGKLAMAAI